jgi:hypothetical protein
LKNHDAEEWLKNHDAEEWLKNHDAEEWLKNHDAEEWLKDVWGPAQPTAWRNPNPNLGFLCRSGTRKPRFDGAAVALRGAASCRTTQ